MVSSQKIANAKFYLGDMENKAFLSTLPMSDTVLLLAVLDTSLFVNKTTDHIKFVPFCKTRMYYEGHVTNESHVPRMYEFLLATNFTRFEYLGRFSGRILMRCSRDMIASEQLPPKAVTSTHRIMIF